MNNRTRISSLAFAILATLFVFSPTLASADEFDVGGWEEGYSDVGGWEESYGDVGGWEEDYSDLGGWEDPYSDMGGWEDPYTDMGGWEDPYGDVGGWDGGYSDVGGWTGGYGDVGGWSSPTYSTGSHGERYYSSSGGSSYYPTSSGWSAPAPRSTGGGYSYSSPISVSSGRSYAQPSTPVVISGGGSAPVHNNNNNVNNNTNVNNVNVSATAIAIAPAPVATPVAAYIPPPVYTHPAPYCTISVTNTYGAGYYGAQQTLNWNSTNAHSASINPIIGSVSTNGSRIVSNIGGQVYTMTVWGPGGSATCQTQPVYVAPPTPYIPQVATPYVSLSQIPYTGFDYGPVGNAMYWVSLALVAFSGAYLMVYYKGGMLALAGSMIGRGNEQRSSRLAEFTPLPESAFAPAKKVVARAEVKSGYTGTSDAMSFVRSANGAPKIVINRA